MDKERAYRALIADIKGFYIAQESIHKNDPVYLTWFNDCEEINLWTYWQGYQLEDYALRKRMFRLKRSSQSRLLGPCFQR